MKKGLFIAIVFFIVAGFWCLIEARNYKKESDWFCQLSDDWHLFEANYTEDIKNIDRLRDDLRWEKEICLEWERLAMEFKQEAFEYKMKFKDKWVNKNVGLLSKARQ
jgi:hypothetical protein